MLYLSERSLKSARSSASIMARIEGRNVVPVAPASARAHNLYLLDTGSAKPDIRTKLIRLRLDGNRIVPYYSRREIERDGLPNAKVLAWVSDRAALYSMQIQGSGKVRLPDGKLVRLAYAEQNGHPFRPALQALPMQENKKGKRQAIVTRGIGLPASDDESMPNQDSEEVLPSGADADTDAAPLTRAIPRPQAQRIDSSDLEKMIEALSAPSPADARPAAQQTLTKKQVEKQAEQPMQKKVQKQAAPASGPENVADSDQASVNTDPSYVFFREIPDDDGGPIGALGVQLTAGRSIAVDPRTTPLGFPVFVSTTYPGKRAALNRLMLAQDTGGAIRGAVRADYFWGFGQEAYALAARMKENGKMWLFFPKKQDIPASAGAIGLRGAATEQQLAECVVPDPELCVE
jgi:membrane-bound lytic murein transglycosylase A